MVWMLLWAGLGAPVLASDDDPEPREEPRVGGVEGGNVYHHDPKPSSRAVGQGRAYAKLIPHGPFSPNETMQSLDDTLAALNDCVEGEVDGDEFRFEYHFSPQGLERADLRHSTVPGTVREQCVVAAARRFRAQTAAPDLKLYVYFTLIRDPTAPPLDHYHHDPLRKPSWLVVGRAQGDLIIPGDHQLNEGERSLLRVLGRVDRCVDGEPAGDDLRFRLRVGPDGVQDVAVERSTMQDATRQACVQEAVATLRLPKRPAPTEVLVDVQVLRDAKPQVRPD